jgi:cyclic pyranopterin phosphate synthase
MKDFNKEIRYVITKNCSYNCEYCHAEGMRNKKFFKENLTPEDYQFLFRVSKQFGINSVSLSGGEPLMRRDIYKVVRLLKKEKGNITITTNGLLILQNKKLWDYVDNVHVSLDLLNKESYEKISKVKGSYDRVLAGLDYLSNKNLIKKINAVSFETTTLKQIGELIDFSKKISATLRFLEIYPEDKTDYISHENLIKRLSKLGYKKINEKDRKIFLESKDGHIIELVYMFCALAMKTKNPSEFCNKNNDLFLTPSGGLKPCRESDYTISILNEVKNKDVDKLKIKLEKAFKSIGKNCIYANNGGYK